ncbi:unnamed protein product [Colias eurytheme]|nr:unnamed protein product [Colias eurytheme]
MFKKYFLTLLLVIWYPQGTLSEMFSDTKIIGGEDAPDGAFPYQVSLRPSYDKEVHFCGGSIIRSTWVLTAAHCTQRVRPTSIIVVVGSNLISSGGTVYNVTKIINHEDYNPARASNDVSLLKIAGEISFNSKVAPIALTDEPTQPNTDCVLTGWGAIDDRRTNPDKLQVLYVQTVPVQECKEELEKKFRIYPVSTKTNVCTLKERGKGACFGDSGGPLAADNKLIGVVSWGNPCANGLPDVFSDVFAYRNWTLTNIANNQ